MIADDIVAEMYRRGNHRAAARMAGATCVRLPFPISEPPEALLPPRLLPLTDAQAAHSDTPTVGYDAPWARPPYDRMVLVSEGEDEIDRFGLVFVERHPTIIDEVWRVEASLLFLLGGRFFLAACASIAGHSNGTVSRLYIDDKGGIDDSARRWMRLQAIEFSADPPPDLAEIGERTIAGRLLTVVATTFALMNCKNVTMSDNAPSRQQRRQAQRSGRAMPYTIRTLLITPGESRHARTKSADTGQPIALHWVRGHFKHYTEENKLFGKYTGTYWWSPHIAGDKAAGLVVKDYKVAAQ